MHILVGYVCIRIHSHVHILNGAHFSVVVHESSECCMSFESFKLDVGAHKKNINFGDLTAILICFYVLLPKFREHFIGNAFEDFRLQRLTTRAMHTQ